MKKVFTEVEIELIRFSTADVVCLSGNGAAGEEDFVGGGDSSSGGAELPVLPF